MIPVKPFVYPTLCERHRDCTPHRITFMFYDPEKQMVSFEAVCLICEEELEDDRATIGYTASMRINHWNRITPEEEEPFEN